VPLRLTLRLVPVAACAWVAAWFATRFASSAPAIACGLWVATLAAVGAVAVVRAQTARLWALVAALALAAAAAASSHVAFVLPDREAVQSLPVTGGRAVIVHAEVVGKIERRADGALAFDAVASRIDLGAESYPVRADVVVRVQPDDVDEPPALDVGARIEARGTAVSGRPGERAVLVVRADRGLEVSRPAGGAARAAGHLRTGLVTAIGGLPGDGAGLVPGLAVGDTSAVRPALDLAMKESSLSHLTAVSGANCALVVGLAFAAAAAAGASRAGRCVAGLAALAGFVLLVTPEPSVVRAGAMAAIAMIAVLLGRRAAGTAILSVAVAALLVVDPWLSSSLGFALSAAATASLLLCARPLARGLERVLPRALALALSVPIAAQLACGPLLVLITPQVSVYGVLANLIAAPAAPVATVVGLAACLAAPIPALQSGLAAVAWLPASWIAATATTFSSLPGDVLPWAEGWLGAAGLAVVGTSLGLLIALRRSSRSRRITRWLAGGLLAVVVGVVVGGGLLGTAAGRFTLPAGWSILACDVGQGDAVLLRSAGAVALVDTGPEPEALVACLDRTGVERIDLLVLSHFDLDHVGGVSAVHGRVGTVLHGPAHGDGAEILAQFAAGGARLQPASAGLSGELGDARWRVVWPVPGSRAFPPGNDSSVILDVRGGGIPSTLLLGDLSASPQRAILAADALDPPYAVVKVAHHGSADQDPGIYRAVAPRVAVITVGADNDYGHPRDEILAELTSLGARIARTDAEGIVAVWQSADGLEVWRERGG
jgi:competence protein ComEC